MRVVALIILLLCIGLGLWRPLWLAPPYSAQTPLPYVALTAAAALGYGLARRFAPPGARMLTWSLHTALAVMGAFYLVTLLLLLALNPLGNAACETLPTAPSLAQYRCTVALPDGAVNVYLFEGAPGSPLARLVESRVVAADDAP